MYMVTGANLFGQWFNNELVLSEFHHITTEQSNDFVFNKATLICSNWSYNIFKYENAYFVSGSWKGKDRQIKKIPIPEPLQVAPENILIHGNDYKLLVIDVTFNHLWIMDLETEIFKKIHFAIERPHSSVNEKIEIVKVVSSKLSTVFLTSSGLLYMGLLPSLIDTNSCIGKIVDVECGYEHYLILTDMGMVYSWGNGRRLQLGHGDLNNVETPKHVEALGGIKIIKICVGGWHSLALSESGDIYVWGLNDTGQLGIKDHEIENNIPKLNSYSHPILVNIFDENNQEVQLNVKDIACGTRHSVILLEDETVWTTGNNKYGQLGVSPLLFSQIYYFKKVFECKSKFKLWCAHWSTTLVRS